MMALETINNIKHEERRTTRNNKFEEENLKQFVEYATTATATTTFSHQPNQWMQSALEFLSFFISDIKSQQCKWKFAALRNELVTPLIDSLLESKKTEKSKAALDQAAAAAWRFFRLNDKL